jgi:hypothetical protein
MNGRHFTARSYGRYVAEGMIADGGCIGPDQYPCAFCRTALASLDDRPGARRAYEAAVRRHLMRMALFHGVHLAGMRALTRRRRR